MNDIRLQSMLGNIENSGRPDLNMGGYTCLARIIKIHHKRNTADVRLVRTNDVIMSVPQNEGKFSCRIGTAHAHFDPKTNKASGVIEPLYEGQLVIVGYLENLKNEPWILASLHWSMEPDQNILPVRYPIGPEDIREYAKYLRVFPSQDYFRVDGGGNIEFALHGKTFLKIDEGLSDAHDGTDFEDLLEKDKFTKKTRTMEDSKYHDPKSILLVHRDNWNDDAAKRTKFFLNGAGLLRISRDNRDNKLTFLELSDNGSFRIKRQLDGDTFDCGENNVEVKIDNSSNARITHNKVWGNNRNVTAGDISKTGAFKLSKDFTEEREHTNTSISITGDNQVLLNRQHSNSQTRNSENTSITINQSNEAKLTRSMSTSDSYRNTEISINAANNITASIATEEGLMVSIQCSASGTVTIYGKNGVTLKSDDGFFSV